MNAIRIHKRIDSETLHLPELKPLLGKTVEILILERPAVADPGCFADLPAGTFDPQELEAMRPSLTEEQYQALRAVASQGGPDVEAIAALRAASRQ